MAIPKEPRALMVQLMYLVLTAMLALNVSAKIMNAFLVVNEGLDKSNAQISKNIANLPEAIKTGVKKNPRELQKYADPIEPLNKITSDFVSSLDGLVEKLVGEASPDKVVSEDDWVTDHGHRKPAGYKNKDVPTRVLVGEPTDDSDGEADKLAKLIQETRLKMIALAPDDEAKKAFEGIPLELDLSFQEGKDGIDSEYKNTSWAEFNFKQMPVIATLPIFNKIKNDALASQSQILSYCAGKAGGDDIVFDKFRVVSAPKKSYIIKGEKYEADLFLSASSSNVKGMSVTVGGSSVPVKEGVAKYSTTTNSTGVKKYKATISMTNPVTGEKTTESSEFEYEVGERSVNVAAEKMNVFYIGVDNPVAVTAAGVSSNELKVNASGGGINLQKQSSGKYIAKVTSPTDACKISVSGGGLTPTDFKFRVKRIPDPAPMLGKGPTAKGGAMGSGTFKAQLGVAAILENFDFDAKCRIQGFELTKQARRADPVSTPNNGSKYTGKAANLVQTAKPGDVFYFDNIKARCPGDKAGRKLGGLIFKIR